MSCNLLKHEPVTRRRKMIVAQNVEMFLPVLVGFGRGEEDPEITRQQEDQEDRDQRAAEPSRKTP